jgi:hypothetical protein
MKPFDKEEPGENQPIEVVVWQNRKRKCRYTMGKIYYKEEYSL